jgi:hypothetical protein
MRRLHPLANTEEHVILVSLVARDEEEGVSIVSLEEEGVSEMVQG